MTNEIADITTRLEPVARMTRDLRAAAATLSDHEARFLVDAYYMMQENRIRSAHQVRQLGQSGEPNSVLSFLEDQSSTIEGQIKSALDRYSGAHPVGQWMRAQKGIGPVLAAGLLAHIDITKAPTVGHIWRFAGLDPTQKWEKGQKRPWNAALKTLCWKIGESFVKVSGAEDAYYGGVYRGRKEAEVARNERGEFAEQAAAVLAAKKIGKDTEAFKAYSVGKLPAAHLHARAKRYAVKLFLAHMHEVWYRQHYGTEPPLPYPIAILGHAHRIPAPGGAS